MFSCFRLEKSVGLSPKRQGTSKDLLRSGVFKEDLSECIINNVFTMINQEVIWETK